MLQINNRGLFVTKLTELINSHSMESDSDTPDFVLAEHMTRSLESLNATIVRREEWYGRRTSDVSNEAAGDCLNQHEDLFCNLPPGHGGAHQALGSEGMPICSWE